MASYSGTYRTRVLRGAYLNTKGQRTQTAKGLRRQRLAHAKAFFRPECLADARHLMRAFIPGMDLYHPGRGVLIPRLDDPTGLLHWVQQGAPADIHAALEQFFAKR